MSRLGRAAVIALAAAVPAARAARAQDAIALTGVNPYANIAALSVIATTTGDQDGDARLWVEYRAAGEPVFRRGHDLVRLSGGRFAGSVLFLAPATDYDVAVVADDPDNPAPLRAAAATRTRDGEPVSPAPGSDDWYVEQARGSDAGPGSESQPFATIQRAAQAAAPGDVVHVRRGTYREQVLPPRGGTPLAPIRFVGEGPGVVLDGSDAAIAAGATWTAAGGSLYWTPFTGQSIYLALDDTRVYDYQSLADLQAENGNIGQAGVFPGGFFVDVPARRLYLITPGHDDPAAHQVHVAVLPSAFLVDSVSDLVIEGFEVRYYGATAGAGSVGVDLRDAVRCWVRHNHFHHLGTAVRVRRPLSAEHVIEGNLFRDTSVYGWPWSSVKNHTPEDTAISITHGHGHVVRWNHLEGSFNGIYTGVFGDADEEIARDTDVAENRLRFHGDDGFELEGAQRNVRYRGNAVDGVLNAVSLAPVEVGPAFVVGNVLAGYAAHAFKVNNGTYGRVLVYHNTSVPQPAAVQPAAQAIAPSVPFGAITTRNNVWESNRYVIEYGATTLLSPIDWDRDALWTHDTAGRYVKWLNVRYPDQPALAASATIEANGIQTEPRYEDAARGDLTPVAGSPLVDGGVPLPGIDDTTTVGAAPDLGAFERGGTPPGRDLAGLALLLRNDAWPARPAAAIFAGLPAACRPPVLPGCGVSLDPVGADCDPTTAPADDDDAHLIGLAADDVDPDPTVLGDRGRPLVFYQVEGGGCATLHAVKRSDGRVGLALR